MGWWHIETNCGLDCLLSIRSNRILKNYCTKKDIRNDVLHQVDLVANAIPGVEKLTSITQRNSRITIKKS